MQADLIDFSLLKSNNDRYEYILVVIDVFSKKAFTVFLKSKSRSDMIQAFEQLMPEIEKFQKLQTDMGHEFLNRPFQTWLKQHHMEHFHTQNFDTKASIAERFIRTLKEKLGVTLRTPTAEDMWKCCLLWLNLTTTPITDPFDVLQNQSTLKTKKRFGSHSMPTPS